MWGEGGGEVVRRPESRYVGGRWRGGGEKARE